MKKIDDKLIRSWCSNVDSGKDSSAKLLEAATEKAFEPCNGAETRAESCIEEATLSTIDMKAFRALMDGTYDDYVQEQVRKSSSTAESPVTTAAVEFTDTPTYASSLSTSVENFMACSGSSQLKMNSPVETVISSTSLEEYTDFGIFMHKEVPEDGHSLLYSVLLAQSPYPWIINDLQLLELKMLIHREAYMHRKYYSTLKNDPETERYYRQGILAYIIDRQVDNPVIDIMPLIIANALNKIVCIETEPSKFVRLLPCKSTRLGDLKELKEIKLRRRGGHKGHFSAYVLKPP